MLTYKHIYKLPTTGVTNKAIQLNPKRIGILIQNLSSNTLYICTSQKFDSNAALEINGFNPYCDEIGASSALSLVFTASDDIRIEEIFKV